MVHVIKFYFRDEKNEQQIRRLAVNSDVVGNYDLLIRKIKEIFPTLGTKAFEVTWKDSENDVIHMSSDDELAQALANAEDGLIRIYIFSAENPSVRAKEILKSMTSHNEPHPNVVCDACNKNIFGYRYKCLQCRNFDLCSSCNAADEHSEHDMIKLVKPTYIPREWVFLGARKMWKSMFGYCGPYKFDYGSSKGCPFYQPTNGSAAKPSEEKKPTEGKPQWQQVVSDLLNGDYVAGEKLLKDNLGNFLNFVDSFAGFDVKIENQSRASTSQSDNSQNSTEAERNASPQTEASGTPSKESLLSEALNDDTANIESKEVQKENSSIVNDNINLVDLDTSVTELKNIAEAKVNETSPKPCGLFSEDTSMNAEGWTIVNENENEKKETEVMQLPSEKGAIPKTTVVYPNITESLKSCEISKEEHATCAASAETKIKEQLPFTQDPEILNAMDKMKAMGFTNEGGWLERLLLTKNGNINATLDALYPNTRRH